MTRRKKASDITATDMFCGAGGSSIAAELVGVRLVQAANHWQLAIETHSENFPHANHDCADISQVRPSRYDSTTMLLASPECTNHSLAKTHRYASKQDLDEAERSRATMWDVPRFAEYHDYELVIVENVVEVRKWRMYPAWLSAMQSLGYEFKEVFLNSMFALPTPQSRDRQYVVFWKRGNPSPNLDIQPQAFCAACDHLVEAVQRWKTGRVAGKYRQQYVYACTRCGRTLEPLAFPAASAIDWSLKGQRIGDRGKPLADATIARIRAGIAKYWMQPAVVDLAYDGAKVRGVEEPLFTQTARATLSMYLPFIAELRGGGSDARSVADALATVTAAGNHHGLVSMLPLYIKMFGGGAEQVHPVTDALGTVTSVDHHALLIKAAGSTYDPGTYKRVRTPAEPLWTQTGTAEVALVEPDAFMASYYGGSDVLRRVTEQMPTVTTRDRQALIEREGQAIDVEDCSFRMLEPHEIGAAMAFPGAYKVLGNKRQRVRQYGNAVTPPAMRLLVERCVATLGLGAAA